MTEFRQIDSGFAACAVCDEVVPFCRSLQKMRKPCPIRVHGPRGNRCSGSHQVGRDWVTASHLPTWDEMSDLDKGCALLFTWKVSRERSYIYARDNYPASYREHPLLVALDRKVACRHATAVAYDGRDRYHPWFVRADDAVTERIGRTEYDRLYQLALVADRACVGGEPR